MTDRFETIRQRMVQEQLISRGIHDPRVLAAMREVPRHLFVDDAMQANAYGDYPLPIIDGQTISQPFIVAYMTQALQLTGTEKVLEIGTGSGYQAVILSRLCAKVYTVERLNNLLASSRRVFDRLHCYNIQSKFDDGTLGWPEYAPYDAIMVTAGGPEIPEPLVAQLADPGRLVIPVGDQDIQELHIVTKKNGLVQVKLLERVRFVNLIGEHGWNN
ncbi:MAG: protein-L-isoaspartate(D-aspartate) O-methyltransferase [Deltaproteobacteria bacterium]|nr:protein-L-isoaspartate(D-aspartate) O-methyltransferase [Deltaproteobacteria bacterium]